MGPISLKSRLTAAAWRWTLDRSWEAEREQSELLFGNTSWSVASVHSHASHRSWPQARASDIHSASAWCTACPLTSGSGWKRWCQQGFPLSLCATRRQQLSTLCSFEATIEPRPEFWVQEQHGNWIVFQFESRNIVFVSGPYLRYKVCVCVFQSQSCCLWHLLLLSPCDLVTGPPGASKVTAPWVHIPGIHVDQSLPCDLLGHGVGLKNVSVHRWNPMVWKGLVSIIWSFVSEEPNSFLKVWLHFSLLSPPSSPA